MSSVLSRHTAAAAVTSTDKNHSGGSLEFPRAPGSCIAGADETSTQTMPTPLRPPVNVIAPHRERALSFEGVSFSYGKAPFMRDLSFSVPCGEVTGIIGPNGCGKSTLLRLGVRLLAPHFGRVLVVGRDLASLSGRERARAVALLPQSLPATGMSVSALVACGRYAYRRMLAPPSDEDRKAIADSLARVGLDGEVDRHVDELSGGQRQRAYLAMVLAQNPRLLLLDEPTSALDIRASHEVLALVRALAGSGEQGVCMVVHDLDLALRYCDRIIVMDAGAIVAAGSPDEVAASGAIEHVFDVAIAAHQSLEGRSWTFFPR